jgi:hypothetical protein
MRRTSNQIDKDRTRVLRKFSPGQVGLPGPTRSVQEVAALLNGLVEPRFVREAVKHFAGEGVLEFVGNGYRRPKLTERRTTEQIDTFQGQVWNCIPSASESPLGITAIAVAAGIIDSADGWTRVLRRRVNDAISSLLADDPPRIEVFGRGKATKYRRAPKRETDQP